MSGHKGWTKQANSGQKRLPEFFYKYRAYLLSVAAVVVVAFGVSFYLDYQYAKIADKQDIKNFIVLPERIRIDESGASAAMSSGTALNATGKPLVLKGIVSDENGDNIAIISAGENTYVASKGMSIGVWQVKDITDSKVIVANKNVEMSLGFQEKGNKNRK